MVCAPGGAGAGRRAEGGEGVRLHPAAVGPGAPLQGHLARAGAQAQEGGLRADLRRHGNIANS